MLLRLHIENIALIDRLELELLAGFNVLTGETGAGKSIIIDSVNLVLGERADRSLIRSGQEKGYVEALFEVPFQWAKALEKQIDFDFELEDDMDFVQLILSRELSISGKNVCRVNGRLVTLTTLKRISEHLVDIHGQHEHQTLFKASAHLALLDEYGKDLIAGPKEVVAKIYHEWHTIHQKIKNEIGTDEEYALKLELLQFQVDEIAQAALIDGEEEQLKEERHFLSQAERTQSILAQAIQEMNGNDEIDGVVQRLQTTIKTLSTITPTNDAIDELQQKLNECYYILEDIGFELPNLYDENIFDAYRYDEVEQRLEIIEKLKRKYGSSIEAVMQFEQQAQAELEELVQWKEIAQHADETLAELSRKLYTASANLHRVRVNVARQFEHELLTQLHDLGMEKARFAVEFSDITDKDTVAFTRQGIDSVEMILTTNSGEPLKPLRKVASGGELSRIMLAFKSIFAQQDEETTMIFDEIDVGISGRVSMVVGEKMKAIAHNHQVICVTHSPQIAAMADVHFSIQKMQQGDRTHVVCKKLTPEEHIEEVARIAGTGEASEQTLAYARELVEKGKQ